MIEMTDSAACNDVNDVFPAGERSNAACLNGTGQWLNGHHTTTLTPVVAGDSPGHPNRAEVMMPPGLVCYRVEGRAGLDYHLGKFTTKLRTLRVRKHTRTHGWD